MQDVARAAGVHQTTVSMALRNHPRLSPATAERVRGIARDLGYRPNPLVSALIAGRRRRGQQVTATLGYVVGDTTLLEARRSEEVYRDLLQGVRERAEELGYGLDVLRLGEPGMTRERFRSVARTRAIHGLIIAPLKRHQESLDIEWGDFACVAYGYSMARPRLHRVCPDFYHSMLEVMGRSRAAGGSRVGLAIDRAVDAKSDHLWLSAFMADQKVHPPSGRPVPPLLIDRHTLRGVDVWIARHEPQIVVALPDLLHSVREIWRRLQKGPEPVWISLDSDHLRTPDGFPGVVLDRHAAGAACVDVVTSMIYRNEHGLPQAPQNILLESSWAGELPLLEPSNRTKAKRSRGKQQPVAKGKPRRH